LNASRNGYMQLQAAIKLDSLSEAFLKCDKRTLLFVFTLGI
jgi:hypothetical protein